MSHELSSDAAREIEAMSNDPTDNAETPRTDAQYFVTLTGEGAVGLGYSKQFIDFARELERELQSLRGDAERLTRMNAELSDRLAQYRLSPEHCLQLTGFQIEHLWDFVDKEREAEITLGWGPAFDDEDGHTPEGLRAWFTEYPEEGSLHLFATAEEHQAAIDAALKEKQ